MSDSPDLAQWLLQQITEDERAAGSAFRSPLNSALGDAYPEPGVTMWPSRLLAECEAKKKIIEWHQSWPVLVQTPPTFENNESTDPSRIVLRASQQIAWLTQQEYVKRFGTAPPSAPILRLLALPYADREGYDESWRP